MTPEAITAATTGLVTVIAAIGALIVSLRTAASAKKDYLLKDEKLKEIHVLVNSRLTVALNEIKELKEHIDKEKNSNLKASTSAK